MEWLLSADSRYLTPALFAIAALYRAETVRTVDSFLAFLNVFVPTFMCLFVGLMAFGFLPRVYATNRDLATKRAMILYLPVQVVARIPTIRKLVDDILQRNGDRGGTVSRSRRA